jgi:hypothetical protein
MKRLSVLSCFVLLLLVVGTCTGVRAQTITATLEGQVVDSTGAAIPGAKVTAVNANTGFTRTVESDEVGQYSITALPVGPYDVSVETQGFRREVKKVTLQIGQTTSLNFSMSPGEVTQEVVVEAGAALLEPTRTAVSSVIVEKQIETLPVNGRQFIDFTLLAPGVQVGETTAGSTDVIVEPVTKLSFGGQNIHYNFVAIDGADNMSTASGIHKTTPSQEAVQEFQVINTSYSTEFGRSAAGIVNIVTKSGTNDLHGSGYWFFRNNALDANSILLSPDPNTCSTPGDPASGGCALLDKLQQNQFGATLGGPIVRDKTFFFTNYEGQRRNESPFYNSALLANIGPSNPSASNCDADPLDPFDPTQPGEISNINCAKVFRMGLAPEQLNVTRESNWDNFLAKLDHSLSDKHFLVVRYFFNDGRFTDQSPLNDGFDAPSTFRNNFFRDQSLLGGLTSTFSPTLVNTLRVQYAHRSFDFPSVSMEPHLEIANTFTTGVNRGNPDIYKEKRLEFVDNVSWTRGGHTLSFGGDFNRVNTFESFPLFSPAEMTFATVGDYVGEPSDPTATPAMPNPFVIFWETFPEIGVTGGVDPALFFNPGFPEEFRQAASTEVNHYYSGLFFHDKWRATTNLTLNYGVRYDWESWPSRWVNNDLNNVDPRFGFAYNFGGPWSVVLRGGAGIFHGNIPSPLLMCQEPSCGGIDKYPGRESIEDDLNARTLLFAIGGIPAGAMQFFFSDFLQNGNFPSPFGVPGVGLPTTIVRFAKDHQAPYSIQTSLGFEFEPIHDVAMRISYLRVKGVHLGSFFSQHQLPPLPAFDQIAHDSSGNEGTKPRFFDACFDGTYSGGFICGPGAGEPAHVGFGFGGVGASPAFTDLLGFPVPFGVFFEADSRWKSVFDGLLVNVDKRFSRYLGFGISYTFSKTLDDGPNPSFVLIPQNSFHIDQERAVSSDSVKHRFVGNVTVATPTDVNPLVNNFEFGAIFTAQSPHYSTIYAGFDANGDIFSPNDRVGIEPRNTFKGDNLTTLDLRVSRKFPLGEKAKLELIAEAFNIFNTLNVRFYNTVYGASDFCGFLSGTDQTAICGPGPFFTSYQSPNPSFGTPRAINNPRQIQFAVKFTF